MNIVDKIKKNLSVTTKDPVAELTDNEAMMKWEQAMNDIPQEVVSQSEAIAAQAPELFSEYDDKDMELVMELWPLGAVVDTLLPLAVVSSDTQFLKFITMLADKREDTIEDLVNNISKLWTEQNNME